MAMDYFATVKRYFDKGYYDSHDVKIFVLGGKITEAQYLEITGIDYVDDYVI